MLFNSLDFAVFLPIVFFLYWFVFNKKIKVQNTFILIASYFFYGWWDWRFLFLILFSTITDFLVGKYLYRTSKKSQRKLLLWISIIVNLGLLGFFKYYNFFVENFIAAFSLFGNKLEGSFLNIILPVGISFYTFQTLSYTIDIYRKNLKPAHSFISFAAFVSFFPQLVAGPIERARNLLPQFYNSRNFDLDNAKDGLRQILWGLFKKMVIADNCAFYVDKFFGDYQAYSGSSLFIGAFFFTIQIYCDFSGYSDIAIGTARLFGFQLSKNFDYPYFSRNVAEFWRRWHISLSTWFRDYVYIPLGGSRGSTRKKIRNTFAIFLISGFWHGANWTFVIWGGLNAIYFLPLLLSGRNRKYKKVVAHNSKSPKLKEYIQVFFTFILMLLTWVFFRSENLNQAIGYLSKIFSTSLISIPEFADRKYALVLVVLIVFFLIVEWFGRKQNYALEGFGLKWKRAYRWGFYYAIIFCLFFFLAAKQQFIYFQF